MRRHRRFPLISLLVALALAGAVLYISFVDVDVPRQALARIGEAAAGLGRSLSNIGRTDGTQDSASGGGSAAGSGFFGLFRPTPETPGTGDDGLPMLVNLDHPVPDGYAMASPVRMATYCDPNIVTIKNADIEGEKAAADALVKMLAVAIQEGVGDWQISAGYRSAAAQQQVWDDTVRDYLDQGLSGDQAQRATAGYVAPAGHSEHETGLAFDVTVPGQSFPLTPQSQWLAEHCWEYGFIIRYTQEKQSITKINAEPWHIRYVGEPHALRMRDADQCLEEYVGAV